MSSHSSTFAWRIPWTEEPGGLQSMGSQSVRHDSVTNFLSYVFTVPFLALLLIFYRLSVTLFPFLFQLSIVYKQKHKLKYVLIGHVFIEGPLQSLPIPFSNPALVILGITKSGETEVRCRGYCVTSSPKLMGFHSKIKHNYAFNLPSAQIMYIGKVTVLHMEVIIAVRTFEDSLIQNTYLTIYSAYSNLS